MRKSDILTFSLYMEAETDLAIGVTPLPDGKGMVWLPKSQIEYDGTSTIGERVDVQLPRWLADAKGLEE
jgi:hypothetical protein